MAFANLKFYGESLGMQTEVYVVIPQQSSAGEIGIENNAKQEKYKCLYLLHGLSDDHTIWLRRRGIEGVVLELGLISCGFNLYKYHLKKMAMQEAA